MSRPFLAAATAVALSGALAATLYAQAPGAVAAPSQSRSISVTGSGVTEAAPDIAILSLGVTSDAPTAREALDKNNAQMTAVIEALKTLGFGVTNMQTTGLSLNPVYDHSGDKPVLTGYQAVNGVTLKVKDLNRLGEILDLVVSAGANQINGLTFDVENKQAAVSDARVKAMTDAKAKAEMMAGALGATIGRPITISESYSGEPQPMAMQTMNAASASVPIATGQVGLQVQVSVVFELN